VPILGNNLTKANYIYYSVKNGDKTLFRVINFNLTSQHSIILILEKNGQIRHFFIISKQVKKQETATLSYCLKS
jgi:hypothetical protein